jgi:hypothetical protein
MCIVQLRAHLYPQPDEDWLHYNIQELTRILPTFLRQLTTVTIQVFFHPSVPAVGSDNPIGDSGPQRHSTT